MDVLTVRQRMVYLARMSVLNRNIGKRNCVCTYFVFDRMEDFEALCPIA